MKHALVAALFLLLAGTASAAPGDPDPTFSDDGQRIVDFADGRELGNAVAIAPSGAIVVAGGYREAGSGQTDDFAIARVSSSGASIETQTPDIQGGDETAFGVAFNGFSDTIVLSGFSKPNPGVTHNEFAAVRLDSILQPDPSFNGTGAARVDFGTGAVATDVAVDSLFRIVQVGVANAGSGDDDFALTRIRASDGTLDGTFSGGKVTTDRGGVEQANAVAIQSDDKIVVAGISGPPGDFDWAVARYSAIDGSPDTSWSPDGWRETDFGAAQEYANDIAIQPDGKIVVAGNTDAGFALARYNTNGTLDTSFSGDGKLTTAFGGQSDVATGVAVQPDGRIVAGGHSFSSGGVTSRDFALARYDPDGALDTTFSGDGKQTLNLGATDIANGIALQADGKIVLVGTRDPGVLTTTFAITRFEGGGPPPDSDGDGLPDADDDCPFAAATTASGCPTPVDPFPSPPVPLPTPPPPAGGGTPETPAPTSSSAWPDSATSSARERATIASPAARSPTCCAARPATTSSTAARARTSSTATSAQAPRSRRWPARRNDVIRGGSGNDRRGRRRGPRHALRRRGQRPSRPAAPATTRSRAAPAGTATRPAPETTSSTPPTASATASTAAPAAATARAWTASTASRAASGCAAAARRPRSARCRRARPARPRARPRAAGRRGRAPRTASGRPA